MDPSRSTKKLTRLRIISARNTTQPSSYNFSFHPGSRTRSPRSRKNRFTELADVFFFAKKKPVLRTVVEHIETFPHRDEFYVSSTHPVFTLKTSHE